MARRKKNKTKKGDESVGWYSNLKEETKHSIFAVLYFSLALFFVLAIWNKAGLVGDSAHKLLESLFGAVFFLIPLGLFLAAISLITSYRPNFIANTSISIVLFLISTLGATEIIFGERAGGYVGYLVSWPFLKFFDFLVSLIIFGAIFVVSLLMMFDIPISFRFWRKKKEDTDEEEEREEEEEDEDEEDSQEGLSEKVIASAKEILGEAKSLSAKLSRKKSSLDDEESEEEELEKRQSKDFLQIDPPPIELLEKDRGKASSGDVKANGNIIKRTLQNFGIDIEMGEVSVGPSFTQYTLKPAEGIKLSRITSLQNDLALSLAAHPLRIEAPIPGKALVGIEIPNNTKTIVGLGSLLSDEEFKKENAPLLVSLGKDVSGNPAFAQLSKMPHLLIAGSTGSGKSIYIHSLIIALLYRHSPESLRFIMIDPKRVELSIYNDIPHMLAPVITDAKKTILTLKWACKEMEKRYETLLKAGVRDINSYHKKSGDCNSMPYIVIIIDELADIMNTYPRELESSIVRLAQMSRAVGIHLIVSTQRPSVEVITGLIKANITTRIALQVASQIDSRTILDMSGAEKLIGKGDMLFLSSDASKPRRIQGAYISEKEVKRVVKYLVEEYEDIDMTDIEVDAEDMRDAPRVQSSLEINLDETTDNEDEDEFYEEAREMVIKTGKASSSYLQRKFKIGYARAARLIDTLEERGVVGPQQGAKPRDVLIRDNDNNNDANEMIKENKQPDF